MAEPLIPPDADAEEVRKGLGAALKKGNLKLIGMIGGALIILILFTTVDFGSLFKGSILGQDGTQNADQPTGGNADLIVAEFTSDPLVTDSVNFSDAEELSFSYVLSNNGFVIFRIFDAEQIEVHSFSQQNVTTGTLTTTTWDGVVANGTIIGEGTYTYSMVPENDIGIGTGKSGTFTVTVPVVVQQPEEPEQPVTVPQPEAAPPTIVGPIGSGSFIIEEDEPQVTSGLIRIISDSVFPVGFNPILNETKITYDLSANAAIELTIFDDNGDTVISLIDGLEQGKGEHSVWWNGTDSKATNGKVVDPGAYEYKIIAKNPSTKVTEDTATGKINAVYFPAGADFEDTGVVSTPSEPVSTPVPTSLASTPTNSTDAVATMALQSATSGHTAGTGPETLIYLLFPLTGHIVSRRKRSKI